MRGSSTIEAEGATAQKEPAVPSLSADDSKVILWDVKTGQRIGDPLSGHDQSVRGLAFTRDAGHLVTGAQNSRIVLWNVDVKSWGPEACRVANRNLSPEEWSEFVGRGSGYRATCPEIE